MAPTQEELNKYVLNFGSGSFFSLHSKLISKSKSQALLHTGKLSQQLLFTNHLDHNQMDAILIKGSKSNFLFPVLSISPVSY